jgi:hypothetical protein
MKNHRTSRGYAPDGKSRNEKIFPRSTRVLLVLACGSKNTHRGVIMSRPDEGWACSNVTLEIVPMLGRAPPRMDEIESKIMPLCAKIGNQSRWAIAGFVPGDRDEDATAPIIEMAGTAK